MGVEAPQWDELLVGIAAGWEVTRRRAAMALAEAGLTVVEHAATATELAHACADRQPHVAVLTLELCQRAHAGGLTDLRRMLPRTRLVTIVPTAARREVREALRAGADGVVADRDVDAALPPTVQDVAAGQLVVPRDLRHEIDRRPLSHREKQVLGLAVLGATNAEIAQRLWVSEHTVKSHLSSSFSKLGVRSRHEAAELVLDQSDSLGAGVLAATRGA